MDYRLERYLEKCCGEYAGDRFARIRCCYPAANVRALSHNADETRIGSLTSDVTLRIWNTTDYALIEERQLQAPLYAAASSPDGQSLAYGDTQLHLVDTSSLMNPKMVK